MRKSKKSAASRFGGWLGRTYMKLTRWEARVAMTLQRIGIPRLAAKLVSLTGRFTLFASLLYIGFWIAVFTAIVLLAGLVLQSGVLASVEDPLKQSSYPKWQEGSDGFGLYQNGYRVD
ncbi:DUF3742 family protein [Azomonas macrocytogenes]|uniref:DUF3742 family protein n=1 Tax=Azomonas macrocytogenes TaxID=69962 RepID=A0A839T8B4_AZOMA|nr:DUF3742 family protein [Azomonas macrocytogenes]MBB3105349.1 hypothetical protein [Azomonas macrocytogenes]